MTDERDLVAELQALTAESTLENCEKSDLWAFAKQADLATPNEWPEIRREELVRRIRARYAVEKDEAAPAEEVVVYDGPLSATHVPGYGRVRRGETIRREDVTEAQWAALTG